MKTEETKKNNGIVLAVASLCFAPLIAIIGLILGVVGLFRYDRNSSGWLMSVIAVSIAATNMVIGVILALTSIIS